MKQNEEVIEAMKLAFEKHRKEKNIPDSFVDAARVDFEAGWRAFGRFLYDKITHDANDKA